MSEDMFEAWETPPGDPDPPPSPQHDAVETAEDLLSLDPQLPSPSASPPQPARTPPSNRVVLGIKYFD